MEFTKMHGCGNDYIFVDCFKEKIENPSALSIRVSDRHFGIGSDGLILIGPSERADFSMAIFNADGSEGKMCGNGIRCVGKYVYEHGLTSKEEISVETLSGIKTLKLFPENGRVAEVRANMGKPEFSPEKIPVKIPGLDKNILKEYPITIKIGNNEETRRFTAVSMGNPHAVIKEEEIKNLDLEKIGPLYENHPFFPDRINTEFIRIINKNEIEMRVWERGSGETLACGSGACASAAACVLNGYTEPKVKVHLKGGDLDIDYDLISGDIFLTGEAVEVCTGNIDI